MRARGAPDAPPPPPSPSAAPTALAQEPASVERLQAQEPQPVCVCVCLRRSLTACVELKINNTPAVQLLTFNQDGLVTAFKHYAKA
jgi:hypothetical protein